MPPLEYHRPRSLAEAVALLGRAQPLAGGTSLTPSRRLVEAVIDLQELALDRLERRDEMVELGSGVRLQALADSGVLPEILRESARREAGWNLRNAATLGGTVAAGDGRSPLLTTLLALRSAVWMEPDGTWTDLDRVLTGRPDTLRARLMTSLRFRLPAGEGFHQVARTPADVPIVCVAAIIGADGRPSVALGGFGPAPLRLTADGGVSDFVRAASLAYRQAEDAWASAVYRSDVAAALVRRTLEGLGLT